MRLFPVLVLLAACSPQMMMPTDGGGTCGTAQTPPNLVSDGSFECDAMASAWFEQFGTLAVVNEGHTGSKAIQVTAGSNGAGQFGHSAEIVKKASGKAYCMAAWVKGTAQNVRMEALITKTQQAQTFSSPVSGEWIRMPPSKYLKVPVNADDSFFLRFLILGGTAGQTVIVDDVDVYESASDNCTERN